MKRLGIRKVAEKALNTKVGRGTDKVMNFIHRKPGDIASAIGQRTGLNKLKITVSGQNESKRTNKVVNENIKTANRNLIEREKTDLVEASSFKSEKIEGMEFMAKNGVKLGDKIDKSLEQELENLPEEEG